MRGIRVGTAVVTHFFITRSRVYLFISKELSRVIFSSPFPFRHLRQETLITFYNDCVAVLYLYSAHKRQGHNERRRWRSSFNRAAIIMIRCRAPWPSPAVGTYRSIGRLFSRPVIRTHTRHKRFAGNCDSGIIATS